MAVLPVAKKRSLWDGFAGWAWRELCICCNRLCVGLLPPGAARLFVRRIAVDPSHRLISGVIPQGQFALKHT